MFGINNWINKMSRLKKYKNTYEPSDTLWSQLGPGVLNQIESVDKNYYEKLTPEILEKFITDLTKKPLQEVADFINPYSAILNPHYDKNGRLDGGWLIENGRLDGGWLIENGRLDGGWLIENGRVMGHIDPSGEQGEEGPAGIPDLPIINLQYEINKGSGVWEQIEKENIRTYTPISEEQINKIFNELHDDYEKNKEMV